MLLTLASYLQSLQSKVIWCYKPFCDILALPNSAHILRGKVFYAVALSFAGQITESFWEPDENYGLFPRAMRMYTCNILHTISELSGSPLILPQTCLEDRWTFSLKKKNLCCEPRISEELRENRERTYPQGPGCSPWLLMQITRSQANSCSVLNLPWPSRWLSKLPTVHSESCVSLVPTHSCC